VWIWITQRRRTIWLVAGILGLYVVVYVVVNGLSFEPRKDELHFWPTSLQFSHSWIPSVELLRSYNELSAPLPFVVFGQAEYWFSRGIWAGRCINFALSLAVLLIFVLGTSARHGKRILAVIGVLSMPYFMACATHLYTDTMAVFFTVVGVFLHLRRRSLLSAAAFILAISCRQYMIAFPLGIFVFEVMRGTRAKDLSGLKFPWPAVWQFVACASLAGWVALWGGFCPPAAAEAQGIATVQPEVIVFQNSLYALACLGFYFVLPEMILFRGRFHMPSGLVRIAMLCLVAGLGLCFAMFPPWANTAQSQIPTMGYMDKLMHVLLPDIARIAIYYILAALATIRFLRWNLEGSLVLANVLLMMKAHLAWDKYMLPLIVVLWFLGLVSYETAGPQQPARSVAGVPA